MYSALSDDSQDDEVVEKSLLTKLQKKFDELKKNSISIEKYRDLNHKYETLKRRIKKVEDLNLRLQEEVLDNLAGSGKLTPPTSKRSLFFHTDDSSFTDLAKVGLHFLQF